MSIYMHDDREGLDLDAVSLSDIPKILDQLQDNEKQLLLAELDRLEALKSKERAREKFLAYVKKMWPVFIAGRHHAKMADAFERVANGKLKRLIINMPPRHTKSEFGSWLLPSWFLGKFPEKKVIQASHTADLAVDFGRKVRNTVDSEAFQEVFPGVSLCADSKAAGRWNTNKGGSYFAIGVGGAVAGKGADLFIIDDPHSEQEAKLAEHNPEIYDSVYKWYAGGPRQRLQPGGAIIIIMCMTGDTPVLMANGEERPLKTLQVGDEVATFDEGRLTNTKVNGIRSNGVDSIYKIQTQSGRIVRANERHPFLIDNDGVLEWTRVNQLRVGDELVSLKDAIDPQGQRPDPVSVGRAKQKTATTARTQMHHTESLGSTGNGREGGVLLKDVTGPRNPEGCAPPVTPRNIHPGNARLRKQEPLGLNTATASLFNSTMQWLRNEITSVTCAVNRQQQQIHALIGTGSCALTTAMLLEEFGDFCVTTATSPLDTPKQRKPRSQLQHISDFTTDLIVSITPDGQEEVFDVEIDRTENFIANGLVSHNTRWSKRDLTARVIQDSMERGGTEWEVIEFPAILPSGNTLWPEFWPPEEIQMLKKELPLSNWMAQYQQNPTSEAAAIVKREWWQRWEGDEPPTCEFVLTTWDTAFERTNRADYSAMTTWGVFYRANPLTGKTEANLILLNAFRDKLEFPELKESFLEHYRGEKPDSVIVEKKASGAPLIYEMRRMGIPVGEFTPVRGNDKISRLNAVSDIFASGRVWAPNTSWAEEVIEEVASFPAGAHDDLVDCVSLALHRFRQGGYVGAQLDEPEELPLFKSKKSKGYY